MIYYANLQGKDYLQSHQSLLNCYKDKAPSKTTVFRWFKEFGFGSTSLNDDDRCGRPVTVCTEQNVARMKSLITEDPRITEKEIKEALKISSGSLDKILRHDLYVKKRCARWVPHRLTEDQTRVRYEWCQYMLQKIDRGKSQRVWDIATGDETYIYQYDPETKQRSSVWLFQDQAPPVKFKRARSTSKQMIAAFFS